MEVAKLLTPANSNEARVKLLLIVPPCCHSCIPPAFFSVVSGQLNLCIKYPVIPAASPSQALLLNIEATAAGHWSFLDVVQYLSGHQRAKSGIGSRYAYTARIASLVWSSSS